MPANKATAYAIPSSSFSSTFSPGAVLDEESTVNPQPTNFFSHSLLTAANKTYNLAETSQSSSKFYIVISAEISSSIAFETEDRTVNALYEIMSSDHLGIGLLISTFDHAYDCKEIAQSNKQEIVIENEFQKCALQIRVGCLKERAVRYKRDVLKVLLERASFAPPNTDFMFRPSHDLSVHNVFQNFVMIPPYYHGV